jgi:ribonuclease HI
MVNADLWQELTNIKAAKGHKFQCIHVKSHSGNPDNERCDKMAKQQIQLHTLGEG